MFCVMLMSWWLGGPLEDMKQVKLYLIHTSSHCCCKLDLDFKDVLQIRVDEELIAIPASSLCLAKKLKLTLVICHFLSCIITYSTLFWGHSLLENTQAWCSRMWPCVLTALFFTARTSPPPSSSLSKGQGRSTLISPYPLYPSDCPTLTPPRLPVFALALHRTSVTAPATAARSLPSPIPPQAC